MKTLTQRTSPLTNRECSLIATVVNQCEELNITAADIWTIRIDTSVNVVWVHLYDGRQLPFDREAFKAAIAKIKATMPETPRERNQRLARELAFACTKYGINHGQIDSLSFSATLYQNRSCVGLIGVNAQGLWWCRRSQLGCNSFARTALDAIRCLQSAACNSSKVGGAAA